MLVAVGSSAIPRVGIAILAFALALPVHAGAQAAEPTAEEAAAQARARALFDEGLAFADEEDWQSAADRFGRASQIVWSPAIALNHARAERELGQLLAASERVRRVLRREGLTPQVRADAERQLEETVAEFAYLEVDAPANLEVHLDGVRLDPALLDVRMPADPGTHRVELRRGPEVVDRAEVTLGRGGNVEVHLRGPNEPPAASSEPPEIDVTPAHVAGQATRTPESGSPGESGSNTPLVVGVVAGVVVLAAVAVVLAVVLGGGSSPPETNHGPIYIGET